MTRKDRRLSDIVAHAFEDDCVTLAVEALLPVKVLRTATKSSKKYQQITASIREVGLVEPPVVARDPTNPGTFLLLDGHVRIEVLKDLGIERVECLVSTDDEAFTYNKRISRLSPVQEHKMIRRAIYTRKSSEEGLEMEFNSLDAQRESCEAYIASQRSEGFAAIRERYDDGGYSGGTLERPALQRLLADVEAGLIDVIVVYKIDRLSRSLMDFARLVEIFERNDVTFVSVTQSFNTTTSMGRLTLNILLSFAQFEREVIGERIRDKFAASRKKGMWMGGYVPLGYDVRDRKLVINKEEAETVRMIFERFVATGSATRLAKALAAEGVVNKRGKLIDKGFLYKLINNRVYIGEAVHKGTSYPGEHEAIIDRELWDAVQSMLKTSPRLRAAASRDQTPAMLRGLIFTDTGAAMTPTATKKGAKLYRYYTSMDLIRNRPTDAAGPQRLPAAMVEDAVVGEIRRMIATPEVRARALAALKSDTPDIDDKAVIAALGDFDTLWSSLFPAEQMRIVQLLVARVTVGASGLAVDLRHDGIKSLARQMMAPQIEKDAA